MALCTATERAQLGATAYCTPAQARQPRHGPGTLLPYGEAWQAAPNVPAAVDERAVADGLVAEIALDGLLLDRGFKARTSAAHYRQLGIHVVLTPSRVERRRLSASFSRPVAVLRNRIETTTGELTEQLTLVRHHAKSFWGLQTRTAAAVLAHTLLRLPHVQSTYCP